MIPSFPLLEGKMLKIVPKHLQLLEASLRSNVRIRRPELSNLKESSTSLSFRSIPYGSPSSLLFGTPSIIQSGYICPLFSLRILESLPRNSSIQRPLSSISHKSRPTPPPSLHHTTSPNPLRPLLTPGEVRERLLGLKKFRKAWEMELTIMVGKKKVHKSAVVREQCKRRFREAIRLVVMRGAFVEDGIVKFDEKEEGPKKWLVRGFSYVATGTLDLYRCELPLLLDHVRKALKQLKIKAEDKIFERELNQIPALPERDVD